MLSKRLRNPQKRLSEPTAAEKSLAKPQEPYQSPTQKEDRVDKITTKDEENDEKYDTSTTHSRLEPGIPSSRTKSIIGLTVGLVTSIVTLSVAFFLHLRYSHLFSTRIVPSSDLSSLPVSEEIIQNVTPYKHAFELQWGTYRPGLYMGIKSLTALSPNFGLMWFSQQDPQWYDHIRHEATKTDNMKTYYWAEHDGGT